MEFDLIARIRARATAHGRADVLIGIGDDAALLQPPPGQAIAVTMDTLNAGVHFPADTAPAEIGWKALAVNLSDLAAMGATPAWCTLALSLPAADSPWLDRFLDGFLELAHTHAIALIGGDMTAGPLSVTVTAHGLLDPHAALRRDGACAGDDIWVTGTLGDAAAALEHWQHGTPCPPTLRARLDRPTPRVEAGRALAGLAHAAIDLSDGLAADLLHVCRASAVAADIWLPQLPTSQALSALTADPHARWRWQVSGGDDYELCFTASPDLRETLSARLAAIPVPLTRIGRIHAAAVAEVRLLDTQHTAWQPQRAGFVHFQHPLTRHIR